MTLTLDTIVPPTADFQQDLTDAVTPVALSYSAALGAIIVTAWFIKGLFS